MPELPEIETLVGQLRPRACGFFFESIVMTGHPQVFKTSQKTLLAKLPGRQILAVSRRGKYICLELDGSLFLWLHLGMTGQLFWTAEPNPRDSHLHLIAAFRGKAERLVYRDVRRFGKIQLTDSLPALLPAGVRRMGPEPLGLSEAEFLGLFQSRTGRIKNLLLNQTVLAGIGNIYADESLFRAGIDPRRRAHRLGSVRLGALYRAVRETLSEAIAKGGSSIDDFIHTNGSSGKFQNFHRVYGRMDAGCKACGLSIRRIRLAGRSSFYCPQCQK